MQAGPEGLRGNDLPKASQARHLRGFDNEVRIDGDESKEDHSADANNQAKQE
jgi:hypothetical protein